jgi:eukaryotic-like serine/threonine-protein kinase
MDAQVAAKQPGDPRRLGPYELVGRLGQGGMGVVFLGRERRTGRLAAVKALRPELAGDSTFAARFRREVDAARRIDSPHVARVLDADPSATRPWLATEYVHGITLAGEVAATGPLTGDRLLQFATQVAQALTTIHAAGIVHRDLKPTNVLLHRVHGSPGPDRFGVKVIDFGIAWAADATMTRSGLRFGTPSWMAPEQLRDQPAGPATDMFAWGALAAFAATGRHPFGGGPADAVAYRILHHEPDLDGVPEPLRRLVRDALSRDPHARPTAIRILTDLAAAGPPTLPLPMRDPAWVLPAAVGTTLPTDGPTAMTAGPTRRRHGRRVGRLLVAAALLAGLVAAPQVVLAAVDGAPGSSSEQEHTSKRCPDDEEDGAAAGYDPDDAEEQEEERDEDEEEREEQEEGAAAKDRRGDRGPGTAGGQTGCGATVSHRPAPTCTTPAANPLLPPTPPPTPTQPPSTHPPTGDPGSGSGNDVLGS